MITTEVAAARLRAAAAGQREYAAMGAHRISERELTLRREFEMAATLLDMAAEIVEGSIDPLYALLPESHWTEQMRRERP